MHPCKRIWPAAGLLSCGALLLSVPTHADEGMWTFDNPPVQQLQEKYHFTPTQEWLDHVRLSCVRMNDGGSASFVSPHGLLLTNHHVARGQLQKNSTREHDYIRDGFYAATPEQEMKSPDAEVNVLVGMENVTSQVNAAVKQAATPEAQFAARRAVVAQIERDSLQKTGLRSDVVTLYQGGEYWLYRYKKYTDLRLVFAPEQQIAFFGGDPDNFTYPRYDIDFALFRIYENGRSVESRDYLKWNVQGAADGELVFVSGNPGSTSRLDTLAQIETARDYSVPLTLQNYRAWLAANRAYAAQGSEQTREATRQIFGIENSLKAYIGIQEGLADKSLIDKKQKDEADFRALVASRPEEQQYGGAWDAIAQAEQKLRANLKTYRLHTLRWSRLADMAVTIVEYVEEVKKPDGERLDGFHDSQLDSLRFRLFSPAPIYPAYEEALLAGNLQFIQEQLVSCPRNK